MGKGLPALVIIVSLVLGVGAERTFRLIAKEGQTEKASAESCAKARANTDDGNATLAVPVTTQPHPTDNLATAVAAVWNNRPLLVLRYLEEPSSRQPRLHQLADALVELTSLRIPRNAAGDAMLAIWAEHDARDALRYADTLRPRFPLRENYNTAYSQVRWNFLKHFYSLWLQLDPSTAHAVLKAEPQKELRKQILKAHGEGEDTDGKGENSAAELAASARSLTENPSSKGARAAIYAQLRDWAKLDPDAALKFASELPPGPLRTSAWRGALRGALQERPDLVVAFSEQLSASSERSSTMLQAAEHWMKLDPKACGSWLATLPQGRAGDVTVLAGARAMVKESPLEALALLESRNWRLVGSEAVTHQRTYYSTGESSGGGVGPQRRSTLHQILQEVAKTDPQRALRAVGELVLMPANGDFLANPLQERMALIDAITGGWMQSDPEALREFITQMPGASELSLVTSFGFTWAGETAAEAAAFAGTLEAGDLHTRLVEQIVRRGDPEELLAAAATLPEHTRSALENGALTRLAREKPDLVIERLQQLPQDQARSLVGPVLDGIRGQDGVSEAAAWLASYPDQGSVRFHYGSLARDWIRTEPEALASWVDSLPTGANQDEAIDAIANHLSPARGNGDHGQALEWSWRLSNERSRDRRFQSVIRNWHRRDPAAAFEALDGASIPDELRAHVLGSLQRSSQESN